MKNSGNKTAATKSTKDGEEHEVCDKVVHMPHPVIEAAEKSLGVALEHSGDTSLLDLPRRTLLVSRAERNPTPASPWVQQTIEATRKLVKHGEVLVTGTGRVAFDAALWTCAQERGATIVALENASEIDETLKLLLPQRHLLVWPRDLKKRTSQRDALMGALADRAYAVLIRKSGNMAKLAEALTQRGSPIDSLEFKRIKLPTASTSEGNLVHATLPKVENENWEWLTHFTREPDGEFLGESRVDYLRWLCGGVPFEPRDANASLRRILREKRIRACGRLMAGQTPMVCFTALHPSRALSLRRWRPGLLRWSFTKSAVMIRKSALLKLGAKPVRYVFREELDGAPLAERVFMQLNRSKDIDWSAEIEWRVQGDVDLSRISGDDLIALTDKASEEGRIVSEYAVQARML